MRHLYSNTIFNRKIYNLLEKSGRKKLINVILNKANSSKINKSESDRLFKICRKLKNKDICGAHHMINS